MYITSPSVEGGSLEYSEEMANVNFEQALNAMKAGGTEEFLKSTLTVLKIMQNIMIHPDVDKFKKIRLAATVSRSAIALVELSITSNDLSFI